MLVRVAGIALAALVACTSPQAAEIIPPKKTLMVFVGQFNKGTFPGWAMIPYAAEMESNFIVGSAYNVQFLSLGAGFTMGAEIGLAGRFGDRSSAEIFGGASFRHAGLPIGNFVTISPGLVVGLSAVSQSIGIERERELSRGGNADLLVYLGPELAFRFNSMPNVEFVWRTHHRSGFANAVGKMREGSNANVIGVRIPF
jgi:hypothetical protein